MQSDWPSSMLATGVQVARGDFFMRPMEDKVALVTGANAGLGYQLALELARRGATVLMACRDASRAQRAKAQLEAEVLGAKTTTLPLDLSEMESIRGCADLVRERVGHLDLLIHNAGIFGIPAMRNSAGHEMHFATNYLGAFALTGLLLPVFGDAPGTRVVSVGSLAHRFGRLSLHKLSFDELNYNPWRAYARSKVALLSFTLELNRRLAKQGSKITALCAHPGFAPTNIGASHSVTKPKTALGKWFTEYMRANMQTVTEAARPILHAACADGPAGGEYYGPGGWFEIGGAPARARLARGAQDARLAHDLWSASESLTGIRYLSGSATKRAI